MTTEQTHRRNFWENRFAEEIHSDDVTQDPSYKARKAKGYADACLAQYDSTFNQTTKEQ